MQLQPHPAPVYSAPRDPLLIRLPPAVSAARPRTVLLLEDDPALLVAMAGFLRQRGFQVTLAETLGEARAQFQRGAPWTLIISDYHLPDGTGLAFCDWVRQQPGATPPTLLMSGGLRREPPPRPGLTFLSKPIAPATFDAFLAAIAPPVSPD